MASIAEEARRLQRAAHSGPIGKRHSSFQLYDLLSECLALAERCRDRAERAELERLFLEQPADGRRYVEKGSDEFVLVCRFVFPNGTRSAERSNASRYAHCLREASKRQLRSADLSDFLKTKGGLNALYMARPLTRTSVTTKALRLTSAIEVPKDGEFTLTLRRGADGAFDVVALKVADPLSSS